MFIFSALSASAITTIPGLTVSDGHVILHKIVLDQGTYLMLRWESNNGQRRRESTGPIICPRSFQASRTPECFIKSTTEALNGLFGSVDRASRTEES